MKKSLLILVLIVTIISLTAVLVACNDKVEVPPATEIQGKLEETTFYTLASNVGESTQVIEVSSKGEGLIYRVDSRGVEEIFYDFPVDKGSFSNLIDSAQTFEYKTDVFSSTKLIEVDKTATLVSEVKNPKEFLGITDSSVSFESATVVIEINKIVKEEVTTYTLKAITVDYEMTIQGIEYTVESTITPTK